MIKNMRTIYRSVMTVLAVIIGILYFAGQISDPAAIVVGLFAGAFLITSVTSFAQPICRASLILQSKRRENGHKLINVAMSGGSALLGGSYTCLLHCCSMHRV